MFGGGGGGGGPIGPSGVGIGNHHALGGGGQGGHHSHASQNQNHIGHHNTHGGQQQQQGGQGHGFSLSGSGVGVGVGAHGLQPNNTGMQSGGGGVGAIGVGGSGQNGMNGVGGMGAVHGGMVGLGQGGAHTHAQHFALAGLNSSPEAARASSAVSISGPFWQQQLVRAEACRQASTAHHRARASALASRMTNSKTSTAVPILDPNKPVSVIGLHKKTASLAVTDDSSTVSNSNTNSNGDFVPSPKPRPAHPTSTTAPVLQEANDSEPWTGIDLGGIRLKVLSPALFAFTHITTLYINHNQLTVLSPAISRLRQLTHLDATGNQITAIPPELGLITSLRELLLFDNLITDLPLELGTLHQLEFLGIEGNPISESIRHALAEKGTSGLIAYFRDNCPPGPPPPARKWEMVEDEPDVIEGETNGEETFSLMCYNILCERYAPQTMYGYTPSWALEWSYRRDAIMEQITDPAMDVICLQVCPTSSRWPGQLGQLLNINVDNY